MPVYVISMTPTRRLGGLLTLALLVLVMVGCDDVLVGWSAEYSGPLHGRTPATFKTACNDIAGTLAEVGGAPDNDAKSSCTMSNGDTITCDWDGQQCITICESSEQECAKVRDLAYIPPWQQPDRDHGTPATGARGAARILPVTDEWQSLGNGSEPNDGYRRVLDPRRGH
jgi:hypothetical protein